MLIDTGCTGTFNAKFGCTAEFGMTHEWAETDFPLLTQLMGKLLTHDGSGCTEPCQDRHCEGSADSQAIYEVMECVT